MNAWIAASAVLLVAGLGPALVVGSRGDGIARLVGLQLASPVAVFALMAFSVGVNQPSYLIVPLVLAVLNVVGTLVYTRLLGPRA
ncbi:MAG TPA: monovalent cation/H+ antiporter complex subunit F [Mycobacteriales bacterium]|nr:monovalent cation/H+ antiporter complex subunit F [Mycobacteriales bacterium]